MLQLLTKGKETLSLKESEETDARRLFGKRTRMEKSERFLKERNTGEGVALMPSING